jgi:hypothetical protein
MMKGYYMIIFGLIGIIWGLYGIFILNESFYSNNSIMELLGILIVIVGVFYVKGFINKTYYLAIFSVLALLGLFSVHNLLFISLNKNFNYFNIGIFVILLIFLSRSYLRRHGSHRLTWKDEW